MLFPAVIVQASRYDRRRPSCENTMCVRGWLLLMFIWLNFILPGCISWEESCMRCCLYVDTGYDPHFEL